MLDKVSEFEHITIYAPENVNHILREVDDKNSIMTVQKQYRRLSQNPIHEGTEKQIEQFLKQE